MSMRVRIDPKRVARFAKRLLAERKGNVAILTALMLTVCVFGIGIGVDYSIAHQKQSQIDGFADSAVLAAVSPAMMNQTSTVAQQTALNLFLAQLATMPNISYSASNVTLTVTDTAAATGNKRTATLTYYAKSNDMFASVIGLATLPIGGTSSSVNSLSPAINFYMLLDTSPSMEIAATTAGITTMVDNTQAQSGCAFGCHETDPTADNLGNPKNVLCANGQTQFPNGGEDNYSLARCLAVTLRIDLVNQAVQNLMTTAPTIASANHTSYQVALYTIDYNFNTLQAMTSNFTTAQAAAANIAPVTVYKNNCLTSSNCNNDEDSYIDTALGDLYNLMPAPGNGTSNKGDTPQEVLFIVSDGVNDIAYGSGRTYGPIGTMTNPSWCAKIKSKGIRIAMLYLTYNPLPTDAWYNSYIAPFQANIAPDAQTCASPGLYFQVNTDGDVSAALNALFQQAVATAYLSQ